MNWNLFVFAVILNTILCIIQYFVQQHDLKKGKISPRHSLIPGTSQKFLYWQDFYTQTYGDFLGLVWVMNAFIHLAVAGEIGILSWIAVLVITVAVALKAAKMFTSDEHKPDWGYPKAGVISLGGMSHLPYLGLNVGMIFILILKIFTGDLTGILLWTALAGGAIWIASFIADMKTGHFDPLQQNVNV